MSNTNNQLYFVDGITNLSYSAGAFRLDLATIKPGAQQAQDPNKVSAETQAHVIMTPQAFMQTMKTMENFIKLVEDKGIIKFNEQKDAHIKAKEEVR